MKIIKKVIAIGNGAAVYVPREYSGREIAVILPEGISDMKQRILSKLIEYMPNIIGVYLYGSYARQEQTEDSDIDLLVITREKDERIKNCLLDVDARVMPLDGIRKAIRDYPLLIVPILLEAEPLLNSMLLDELKSSKIDIKKFKWNFEDTERVINIIREFIKIDSKDISPSHIYSLIMRIRGSYLIECILKNKRFSNSGVKKLLFNYELNYKEIEEYLQIYRKLRNYESVDAKIKKEQILKLIEILEDYTKKLKDETKKKTEKRH